MKHISRWEMRAFHRTRHMPMRMAWWAFDSEIRVEGDDANEKDDIGSVGIELMSLSEADSIYCLPEFWLYIPLILHAKNNTSLPVTSSDQQTCWNVLHIQLCTWGRIEHLAPFVLLKQWCVFCKFDTIDLVEDINTANEYMFTDKHCSVT